VIRIRGSILLLFFCLTTNLVAQQRLKKPEIFLGVHGGVKASTVLFSPSISQVDIMCSPITGNGGVVFRYAEHKVCALQVECNYMQQGWAEVYGTGTTISTIYKRQLHYIEIPFLMHLGFGKKDFRAFFNFGPQIGVCIKDTYSLSHPDNIHLNQEQHKPIENLFDWGAVAGLGCYYKAKEIGVFQLEARFHFSLGGIYNVGQLEDYKMANPMGISLNIGYLWELKK
jgi:hypothetical protein